MDQIAYVNGSFVPLAEAKVSILDRGFLFADGIYEVSAVLDGKLVDNASHLARLVRSVGEISLALPEPLPRIEEIQHELITRNQLESGLVYIEVTRGAARGRRRTRHPAADRDGSHCCRAARCGASGASPRAACGTWRRRGGRRRPGPAL